MGTASRRLDADARAALAAAATEDGAATLALHAVAEAMRAAAFAVARLVSAFHVRTRKKWLVAAIGGAKGPATL